MIYPSLPAGYDLGFVRIVGAGIGNCFYAYFHAVVMAKEVKARIIAPTWWSVRIGPLLRGERTLRRYGMMFRAHPDEVHGFMKAARLVSFWPGHKCVRIRIGQRVDASRRGLTIVEATEFTFVGLHSHRDMIRTRLLEILIAPPTGAPKWGAGDYAAAHIRLGDFKAAQSQSLQRSFRDGERIPLVWYQHVIRRVRAILPELPVHIFSDGHEHELADLLAIDGVRLWREPNDVADLLALAQARLLIGSNSTFARWAAFLGNMPSVWPNIELREQPTDEATPILYVADDFETVTLEAVTAK
jgi:hypothetical protein